MNLRDNIYMTTFGSHLYGTQTPESDRDYKGVFLPTERQLLLGGYRDSVNLNTKIDDRSGEMRKNEPGEIDYEAHSLKKYLYLLSEGQTVALDILFASPLVMSGKIEGHIQGPAIEVWLGRENFLTKNCKSFVGYAYQQASKYGIKGSRVAAIDEVVKFFEDQIVQRGDGARCGDIEDDWNRDIAGILHTDVISIRQANGEDVKAFECCGRKAMFTTRLKHALTIYKGVQASYGHRARQARNNENVDWKALSHAIRITTQAVELLMTGNIVFPRPDAEYLTAVKTGQFPYAKVAADIEYLVTEVETASAMSNLPEEPNMNWIEDLIQHEYRKIVK